MILGYLSVEWLFLATLGLIGSTVLARNATSFLDSLPLVCLIGIVASLALYGILRLAGKTPIGITYESHPAARGHPLLSFTIATISIVIWAFNIFA